MVSHAAPDQKGYNCAGNVCLEIGASNQDVSRSPQLSARVAGHSSANGLIDTAPRKSPKWDRDRDSGHVWAVSSHKSVCFCCTTQNSSCLLASIFDNSLEHRHPDPPSLCVFGRRHTASEQTNPSTPTRPISKHSPTVSHVSPSKDAPRSVVSARTASSAATRSVSCYTSLAGR